MVDKDRNKQNAWSEYFNPRQNDTEKGVSKRKKDSASKAFSMEKRVG